MSDLVLRFDPNTIEHLGVSLYSQLPSVISELVSNSWDADANEITIDFVESGNDKTIEYSDDGHGMTFDELNRKYLMIGRNRRKDEHNQLSPNGRPVIGKKGLGKLSVFGVCNEVEIRTVKGGVLNQFIMRLDDIKSSVGSEYKPKLINKNFSVSEKNGTKIWLRDVRRKTGFKVEDIAISLSKKFVIFDQILLKMNHNSEHIIDVSNELKFKDFNIQLSWDMPIEIDSEYEFSDSISGKVITLETPIKDTDMRGVYLTSRGKIVNNASFFGLRDTDLFHSYVTGYIAVDFIDDYEDDLISTDRHSLNWENDVTRDLKDHLQKLIKKISNEWRDKRRLLKEKKVENETGLSVTGWKEALTTYERDLADQIVNPILEQPNLDVESTSEIINGVISKFDNRDFKEYASQIASTVSPEEIPKLLKLLEEWKTVEIKQLSDLAHSRIEVIDKFEEYLDADTKEVPTLHNFLKKFSWLLDPRILEFRDEVKYSTLLKESFPEEELEEKDRRIDFLCSNALGGVLYVIEIKRSKYRVDAKALEQAYEYGVFLTDKYASESGFSTVVCYVVGGEKTEEAVFRRKEKTYRNSGEVFVKTYTELLEQSKQFHKEFIDASS